MLAAIKARACMWRSPNRRAARRIASLAGRPRRIARSTSLTSR
jgi:hypothetical protein